MRILVMGAGTVGSVYGGMMAKSGHDVLLVTGEKHAESIRRKGLLLVNLVTGQEECIGVQANSEVPPHESFDFVLVTVRNDQLSQAARDLKPIMKEDTWAILFQNGFDGPKVLAEVIGRERVAIGFGAVGGSKEPGRVFYFVAEDEKTVIGELDGKRTKRIMEAKSVFESAGFSTRVSSSVESYVVTHTALVLPIALVVLCKGNRLSTFGDSPEDLELAVKGMKEAVQILQHSGLKVTTEGRLARRLPNFIIKRLLEGKIIKGMNREIRKHVWQHAIQGATEWLRFREQILEMAKTNGLQAPVLSTMCMRKEYTKNEDLHILVNH